MQEFNLFKFRKLFSPFFGVIGLAIILQYYFTDSPLQPFSYLGVPLLITAILHYFQWKKFFFQITPKNISYKFPGMETAKTISVQGHFYQISEDWKGIYLANQDQRIFISTNGLWQKEKSALFQFLKNNAFA